MRLFFALLPAAEDAARLADEAHACAAQLGAQPVPVANFHVTLCFLGEVAESDLARLRSTAAGVRGARCELRFAALDYWAKPRILCAIAREERDSAAQALSESLTVAMRAADFSPDIKPFRPHVTVARKVPADAARALEWPRPLTNFFGIRCGQFVLMRSDRGEAGSIYSVVDEWLLDA